MAGVDFVSDFVSLVADSMTKPHRIVVLVTAEQHTEIKVKAGLIPLGAWIRSVICQPGKEKGHEADRPSEDAARTSRVHLEGRRTGPRRGRKRDIGGPVRSRNIGVGFSENKGNASHVGVSDSSVADSQSDAVVRHTATSDWHTCLCPSCSDRRKKLDLEIGEIPTKKERSYGGKK